MKTFVFYLLQAGFFAWLWFDLENDGDMFSEVLDEFQ
jgi:hypothetical protein